MLKYKIDDYILEFDAPEWWEETALNSEEQEFVNIPGRYFSDQRLWKRCFKILMSLEQKKSLVPYKLFHVARDIQDQKLIIQLGIGILDYHESIDSKEPMHNLLINISDALVERKELELAKDYLESAKIVSDENDTYQTHYAKIASEKLIDLESIEDQEKFFEQRSVFRKTLNEKFKELEKSRDLVNHEKERLKNMLWREDVHGLSNLELAFLILLDRDLNSSKSKILTNEITRKVRTIVEEYNSGFDIDFDMNLSGIVLYPTELSNQWSLSIDGVDNEVVTVDFDRWEMTGIDLSG